MPLTTTLPRGAEDFSALPQPDWIDAKALAAGVAELFTVPDGAEFVLFSANATFAAKMGGPTVTAAMPTDVADGSASMLNPSFRKITTGQTHISVISAGTCLVTAEYFKRP